MDLLFARLDRARWNKVHTAITIALGVGWLLGSRLARLRGLRADALGEPAPVGSPG